MTVLLVTVLNGRGQFTFFTYLAPSLKASLPDNAELLTLVLAYGTVATLGNVLVTRAVGRLGAPRSALFALLVVSGGLAVWGAAAGSLSVVLAGATLWGLGTFAANSVQQARFAGIAPDLHLGVHIAQHVGNLFWASGRCRYRGKTHPGRNDAGTTIGRRCDPARRSGRVHSGSTVEEVRARRQVNADREARPP